MNRYTVIWTYVANYGTATIMADTPEQAADVIRNGFSDDFKMKGTCYVALADHVTQVKGTEIRRQEALAALKRRKEYLEATLCDDLGLSLIELEALVEKYKE